MYTTIRRFEKSQLALDYYNIMLKFHKNAMPSLPISIFPFPSLLPSALLRLKIVVVQSVQMLSSDISRRAESGHAALAGELVRAILQRNHGFRWSSRIQLLRNIEPSVNRSGRVARGSESGHSALTGELISAAL